MTSNCYLYELPTKIMIYKSRANTSTRQRLTKPLTCGGIGTCTNYNLTGIKVSPVLRHRFHHRWWSLPNILRDYTPVWPSSDRTIEPSITHTTPPRRLGKIQIHRHICASRSKRDLTRLPITGFHAAEGQRFIGYKNTQLLLLLPKGRFRLETIIHVPCDSSGNPASSRCRMLEPRIRRRPSPKIVFRQTHIAPTLYLEIPDDKVTGKPHHLSKPVSFLQKATFPSYRVLWRGAT